jgi:hypothetical protein
MADGLERCPASAAGNGYRGTPSRVAYAEPSGREGGGIISSHEISKARPVVQKLSRVPDLWSDLR